MLRNAVLAEAVAPFDARFPSLRSTVSLRVKSYMLLVMIPWIIDRNKVEPSPHSFTRETASTTTVDCLKEAPREQMHLSVLLAMYRGGTRRIPKP